MININFKNGHSVISNLKLMYQKEYKIDLIIILSLYVIIYFLLVTNYPFPSILTDSANYIHCAQELKIGGFRPFGYSKYLYFIHAINSSSNFFVFSQYLVFAISTVTFLFTIRYILEIKSSFGWYCFVVLCVISPTSIYLTNAVLSDSLFCSLTILWLVSGIWIIYTRNIMILILHLFIMLFAMEVRYTAIFYPVISVFLIFISFQRSVKWFLAFLPICFGVYFYKSTKSEMKREFGVNIFSGFSGWQLANNTLNTIPHANIETVKINDKKARAFYEFAVQFDSSIYANSITSNYIWSKQSPLKQYMFWYMETRHVSYIQAWLLSGKEFEKFGQNFIQTYPLEFAKYYLVPNASLVLLPPNNGFTFSTDNVLSNEFIRSWFKINKQIPFSPSSSLYKDFGTVIRLGVFAINVLFFVSFFYWFFFLKKKFKNEIANKFILLLAIFSIAYLGFSIYAAPYEIRYSVPVRIPLITIPFLVIRIFTLNRRITLR